MCGCSGHFTSVRPSTMSALLPRARHPASASTTGVAVRIVLPTLIEGDTRCERAVGELICAAVGQ